MDTQRVDRFIRAMGWVPTDRLRDQVRAGMAAMSAEAQAQGGGEALEAELIALVAGPYHYHHKMDEHAEREGKAFDRCRELTIQNIRTWCATRRAMLEAEPPSAPVGVEDESVRVGNLPTMNQDGYPGLGEWWVQLWRGDEIIARVYGDGPDEVRSQAQDIADALNQQPAAVDGWRLVVHQSERDTKPAVWATDGDSFVWVADLAAQPAAQQEAQP